MSYSDEKEAVQKVRAARKAFIRAAREKSGMGATEDGDGASHGDGQGPKVSYAGIINLLGQTNYPAMQELFAGSGAPPVGTDTDVVISFELFESVQQRLAATRQDLDKAQTDLAKATQRAQTAERDAIDLRGRLVNLEKQLAESREQVKSMRQLSLDTAEERDTLSKEVEEKGEIIGDLEEQIEELQAGMQKQSLRVSDGLVAMGQKDARLAALQRDQEELVQRVEQLEAEKGTASRDAAAMAQQTQAHRDLDGEMIQLRAEMATLADEKHRALQEKMKLQARGRHIAVAREAQMATMEQELMFLQETVGSHRCVSNFAALLEDESDENSESWTTTSLLKHVVTGIDELRNEEISSASHYFDEIDGARDAAVSIALGTSESLRLLNRFVKYIDESVSLTELKDRLSGLEQEWFHNVARLSEGGVHSFLQHVTKLTQRESKREDPRQSSGLKEEGAFQTPPGDVSLVAGAAARARETGMAHDEHGAGAHTGAVLFNSTPSERYASAKEAVDVENSLETPPKSPAPEDKGAAPPQEGQSSVEKARATLSTQTGDRELWEQFKVLHKMLVNLARIMRKHNSALFAVTDSTTFMNELDDVSFDTTHELVGFDIELVKTLISSMVQTKDEVAQRLQAHRARVSLYRASKLEKAGSRLSFHQRQDVAATRRNKRGLQDQADGKAADDEALFQSLNRALVENDDRPAPAPAPTATSPGAKASSFVRNSFAAISEDSGEGSNSRGQSFRIDNGSPNDRLRARARSERSITPRRSPFPGDGDDSESELRKRAQSLYAPPPTTGGVVGGGRQRSSSFNKSPMAGYVPGSSVSKPHMTQAPSFAQVRTFDVFGDDSSSASMATSFTVPSPRSDSLPVNRARTLSGVAKASIKVKGKRRATTSAVPTQRDDDNESSKSFAGDSPRVEDTVPVGEREAEVPPGQQGPTSSAPSGFSSTRSVPLSPASGHLSEDASESSLKVLGRRTTSIRLVENTEEHPGASPLAKTQDDGPAQHVDTPLLPKSTPEEPDGTVASIDGQSAGGHGESVALPPKSESPHESLPTSTPRQDAVGNGTISSPRDGDGARTIKSETQDSVINIAHEFTRNEIATRPSPMSQLATLELQKRVADEEVFEVPTAPPTASSARVPAVVSLGGGLTSPSSPQPVTKRAVGEPSHMRSTRNQRTAQAPRHEEALPYAPRQRISNPQSEDEEEGDDALLTMHIERHAHTPRPLPTFTTPATGNAVGMGIEGKSFRSGSKPTKKTDAPSVDALMAMQRPHSVDDVRYLTGSSLAVYGRMGGQPLRDAVERTLPPDHHTRHITFGERLVAENAHSALLRQEALKLHGRSPARALADRSQVDDVISSFAPAVPGSQVGKRGKLPHHAKSEHRNQVRGVAALQPRPPRIPIHAIDEAAKSQGKQPGAQKQTDLSALLKSARIEASEKRKI